VRPQKTSPETRINQEQVWKRLFAIGRDHKY
jgi:hypothetical protein